jgi:ABC-type uncharacterized transport system substrate-binding protein
MKIRNHHLRAAKHKGAIMKTTCKIMLLSIAFVLFGSSYAISADQGDFSTDPVKHMGKKWRIGYYEGGEYIDYQRVLIATLKGLAELGWIENTDIPAQEGEQTKGVWQWIEKYGRSDYLEFVQDAHYSAKWDDKVRKQTVTSIINRLNNKKDIDLMIAMGTWAGQDLATPVHHVPTIVVSTSNALQAGIIKSVEDSGLDHLHARIDPYRYQRQIRVFHDIIGFKTLGVAFEDSVEGRSYAAIDEIEEVAKERNFNVVKCYTKSDIADKEEARNSVKSCFEDLVKKVDALYVTVQGGVDSGSISDLVKIANANKIPTFSQSGSHEVKYGILLSLSQAGYKYFGQFNAKTISKVLNGAKPRQLSQLFEAPPKIAINLKTAVAIEYDPPVDVLGAADEIYYEIEEPE